MTQARWVYNTNTCCMSARISREFVFRDFTVLIGRSWLITVFCAKTEKAMGYGLTGETVTFTYCKPCQLGEYHDNRQLFPLQLFLYNNPPCSK